MATSPPSDDPFITQTQVSTITVATIPALTSQRCELASSLPLTTTFTPPTDCHSSWALDTDSDGIVTIWQDMGPRWRSCYPPGYDISCVPQGASGLTEDASSLDLYPTFSPGACPYGYTSALVLIDPSSNETQVPCCRKGMTASTEENNCMSYITQWQTFTLVYNETDVYTYTTNQSITITSPYATSDAVTTLTAWSSAQFIAPMVWVKYKEGEIKTAEAPATGSHPSSTSARNTSSASPTNTTPAQRTSLSTGAKAGIGAGVAVGALLVLGGLLYYFRSRRKSSRDHTSVLAQEVWRKPELEDKQTDGGPRELPVLIEPSELPADQTRH